MHLRETVSVAIDAFRANKLRATLTSLGVIIGSASIVLVVTVALTSKKFVISQIEGVGSNLVWAEMVHATGKAEPLSYEITMGDLDAMQASPGVLAVAGTRELPTSVVVSGVERPVNLIGVTEGFQTIRRLVIYRGRYFDSEDMESRGKVCLITKELSERVFGLEIPSGGRFAWGADVHGDRSFSRAGGHVWVVGDSERVGNYSAGIDEVLHRRGCFARAVCASVDVRDPDR